MHRFFVPITAGNDLITVSHEQAHQMSVVLGLKPGERVILVPGDGRELECEIVTIDKKEVSLAVVEAKQNAAEPVRQVTLYCAVLKRDNFEWVCQKATECGVAAIVPITTDHTVKLGLNEERLQKIMIEAAEQSGRGVVPALLPIKSFKEIISELADFDAPIFFEQATTIFNAKDVAKAKRVALLVGPEGGWSEGEQVLAEEKLTVRSLGPRMLRAETAAIVATFNAATW